MVVWDFFHQQYFHIFVSVILCLDLYLNKITSVKWILFVHIYHWGLHIFFQPQLVFKKGGSRGTAPATPKCSALKLETENVMEKLPFSTSGWWQLNFYIYFFPYLGKWSKLTCAYFLNRLVQPPTRHIESSISSDDFDLCDCNKTANTPCGYCQQNNHSQLTLPLEISSITIWFCHNQHLDPTR